MQIVLRDLATPRSSVLDAFDAWLHQCASSARMPDDVNSVPSAVEMARIEAARSGDQDAFRQILADYQAAISTQMRRFSNDSGVVEGLVHDVFVEAFMNLSSFQGKGAFEHWLRKIAVRIGYRHWKLQARDKLRIEKICEVNAAVRNFSDPPTDAIEAREQLHIMLAKLEPRDRLVLTLLYWDGHSIAEAAQLAGWTQTMVKVQAHRARKRLKKLLEEAYEP